MVRHIAHLTLGLALLATSCGGSGAIPFRPAPTDPVVIGQPPTPDLGDPGVEPDEVWILGPAYIEDVGVSVHPDGRVRIRVSGDLPTPCHEAMIEVMEPGPERVVNLEVWSRIDAETICIQVLAPFSVTADLHGLAPGIYSVQNGGKELTTFVVPESDPALDPTAEPYDGIFPATDWSEYRRVAGEVAEGKRPWLLDPVLTAEAFLAQLYGAAPAGLGFNELGEGVGEVTWPDGRVTVVRYEADGPWVITAAETRLVDVSISDYSGGVLYVGLNPHGPGRLEVHAGVFASEWSASHIEDVAGGELIEVELPMASGSLPGPDRLLVDVRLTAPDGTVSIAQYDVNRTDIVYGD